jgi:hypothetical protein
MSRWFDAASIVVGVLLLVSLARFIYVQWVMEKARAWRDEPMSADMWKERRGQPKPWYVIRDEKWRALRASMRGRP